MRKETYPRIDYFEYVQLCRKRYSEMLEPICRQWKLTRNELDIILFIANHPNHNRAADIAMRRGMAKSHISKSVSSLEEKGFVQCTPDPLDHRMVRLNLTTQADTIKEQALNAQKAFFHRLMKGLTEEDIAFWHQLMERISKNMKE